MCAVAPSSPVLIFARALLGFGAAGLLQGALAIIRFVVPLNKVPLFQGVVVSALGISVAIGPVIGGNLTQFVSWRMSTNPLFANIGSLILNRMVLLDVGWVVLYDVCND